MDDEMINNQCDELSKKQKHIKTLLDTHFIKLLTKALP